MEIQKQRLEYVVEELRHYRDQWGSELRDRDGISCAEKIAQLEGEAESLFPYESATSVPPQTKIRSAIASINLALRDLALGGWRAELEVVSIGEERVDGRMFSHDKLVVVAFRSCVPYVQIRAGHTSFHGGPDNTLMNSGSNEHDEL